MYTSPNNAQPYSWCALFRHSDVHVCCPVFSAVLLMAESSSSGDEEFRGEAKYKQFSAAVERSLKGFELSTEWHDLISSLARLNKVRQLF